jgi:uncharacterized OB-fold protein
MNSYCKLCNEDVMPGEEYCDSCLSRIIENVHHDESGESVVTDILPEIPEL